MILDHTAITLETLKYNDVITSVSVCVQRIYTIKSRSLLYTNTAPRGVRVEQYNKIICRFTSSALEPPPR